MATNVFVDVSKIKEPGLVQLIKSNDPKGPETLALYLARGELTEATSIVPVNLPGTVIIGMIVLVADRDAVRR